MLRIRKRTLRPVRYFRMDVPVEGARSNAYLWQSDRTFRVGDAVTCVPGWARVVVVDEPVTSGDVEHVPVAEAGWARQAMFKARAKKPVGRSRR
jgi:hypothetical protein